MTEPTLIDADGNKFWEVNGEYHREDGPAIEYADGSKVWYRNGEFHREDGPAAVWADGSKCWYQNDVLHRNDGPAVEWASGGLEWWIMGGSLSREEFSERRKKQLQDEQAKETKVCKKAVAAAAWLVGPGVVRTPVVGTGQAENKKAKTTTSQTATPLTKVRTKARTRVEDSQSLADLLREGRQRDLAYDQPVKEKQANWKLRVMSVIVALSGAGFAAWMLF